MPLGRFLRRTNLDELPQLDEMVAIDYLYVANWSLRNDVKLLLRTIPHVLTARGL